MAIAEGCLVNTVSTLNTLGRTVVVPTVWLLLSQQYDQTVPLGSRLFVSAHSSIIYQPFLDRSSMIELAIRYTVCF